MEVKIFISSRTNIRETCLLKEYINSFNKEYKRKLFKYGISKVTPVHIEPARSSITATSVREKITKEIESSDMFFLILPSNGGANEWIMFELGYAMARDKKIAAFTRNGASIPGPLENINRIPFENLSRKEIFYQILINEIENGLKTPSFVRSILINNYINDDHKDIVRYFPLDKTSGLKCGISQTSLNIEPYFLEPVEYSFDNDGLFFNGNFYLRQFIGNSKGIPDHFSVCFWFKIEEEEFKERRFCKKHPQKDEPIFFFTVGSMQRRLNSHVGTYYGRPSVEESKNLDVGMRIFTYCEPEKQEELRRCDSKDFFKEIDEGEWYFAVLSYNPGKKIKLYVYSQKEFKGTIQTEKPSQGIGMRNYLTIGGGFPFSEMLVIVGSKKGWKAFPNTPDEKEKIIEDIKSGSYYTNSSLHLTKGFEEERCKTDENGELLPEENVAPRPYALPLIDDFRFIGRIREFLILNKSLDNKREVKDLWKLTRNLIQK